MSKLTALRTRKASARLAIAVAGLGGLAAALSSAPATFAGGGGIPVSCTGFVAQYFNTGAPDGYYAGFTSSSEATNRVASYADGSLSLTNSRTLNGQGTQFFSDREYYNGGLIGHPFDPSNTDQLGVTIWETTGSTPSLRARLTLLSWGNTPVDINVQGCVGNNELYGTDSAGGANTGTVSISLGPLESNIIQ